VGTLAANAPQEIAARSGCYTILTNEAGAPVTLGAHGEPPVYKAYHRALRCYAALRIIPQEAFSTAASREQVVAQILKASRFRHRNAATILPPETVENALLYATEFCIGETLAGQLLRAEPLPPREALDMARQIAAALKGASALGLPHRALVPEKIFLARENGRTIPKILDFALPCEDEADEGKAVGSLSAILCCMAAGPEQYATLQTMPPADRDAWLDGALKAEPGASEVIKKALSGDPGTRPRTFGEFEALIRSALPVAALPPIRAIAPKPLPPPKRPMQTEKGAQSGGLEIPAALLGMAQPGTILTLRPVEPSGLVKVCAEPNFRIGRSAAAAHFETRFYPQTKANEERTRQLSKVHVTAVHEGGKVLLFDGDRLRPSANGSTFNKQSLSPSAPFPVTGPGELRLADDYSIRVMPVLSTREDALIIRNLQDWKGPAGEQSSGGAVIFVPAHSGEGAVGVWLFSAASFGSVVAKPIDFEAAAAQAAAGVLRHWRGCFWIERRAQAFSVNGLAIAPGQIVPLASGQVLEINGSRYNVGIGPG
jgi:hypothetical protein